MLAASDGATTDSTLDPGIKARVMAIWDVYAESVTQTAVSGLAGDGTTTTVPAGVTTS